MKDYYEVLEVGYEASVVDIKEAYIRLSTKAYDLKNTENKKLKLDLIEEAFIVLSNIENKLNYNILLIKYYHKKASQEIITRFKEFDNLETISPIEIISIFEEISNKSYKNRKINEYLLFKDIEILLNNNMVKFLRLLNDSTLNQKIILSVLKAIKTLGLKSYPRDE